MKEKKEKNFWPLKITVAAFFISITIGILTNTFIADVDVFAAFIILLMVIFLGIIFDVI